MRYCRQRNKTSCGPIAILNALKWAGARVNYRDHYNWLVHSCQTYHDEKPRSWWGTEIKDFGKTLTYCSKGYFTIHALDKLAALNLEVLNPNAMLAYLGPRKKRGYGHFVLFVGRKGGVLAVNLKPRCTTTQLTNSRFAALLSGERRSFFWLLKKTA